MVVAGGLRDLSVSKSSKLPDRVRLLNSYSACVGTYTFPFYIETTTGHFNMFAVTEARGRAARASAIQPYMVCDPSMYGTKAPTSELDVGINAAELSLC